MHIYIYIHIQDGFNPLHCAAEGGHTACVEHLLSTPGIDVNKVSCNWAIGPLNVMR